MWASSHWLLAAFFIIIFLSLIFDLGILEGIQKKLHQAQPLTTRQAAKRLSLWIILALIFNVGIYYLLGKARALEFLAGYVLEYSLSVDNIFVMVLVFQAFKTQKEHQHRVLFWGILGAMIMRGFMVVVGSALLNLFHGLIYIFGAFLLYTGMRLLFSKEQESDQIEHSRTVQLIKKIIPLTEHQEGSRFFIYQAGQRVATPLFITLLVIELTDVIFALDSIPAIFGITTDPLIVFTSNIFAILGLRTLYSLTALMMDKFEYLSVGLAIILSFVGIKMLVSHWIVINNLLSIGFIFSVLGISIASSFVKSKKASL